MKTRDLLIGLLVVLLIIAGGLIVWKKYFSTAEPSTQTSNKAIERELLVVGTSEIYSQFYPESAPEFYDLAYQSNIFQPLVAFDKDNKIVPLLAEKWDNPDDKTWRFYINPKANFSNLKPVTADDVKFTYDYMIKNKLPIASMWPNIQEIKVVNDKTVEFITPIPNPVFLNRLAVSFYILSKEEIETNGIKNHIGSGPYVLSKTDQDNDTLLINENYWGDKPKIKKIVFKTFQTEEEKIKALLDGQVNLIGYGYEKVTDDLISPAIQNGIVQQQKIADPSVMFINLNSTADQPVGIDTPSNPLKSKKVRQALEQAIDIETIVKNAPIDLKVANQMVSSGVFGYDSSIKRLPYDLTLAKKNLEEAGYPDGFSLVINILPVEEGNAILEVCKMIAQDLAKANIKAEFKQLPPEEFYPMAEAHKMAAYMIGYSTDSLDSSEALDYLIHSPSQDYGLGNLGYKNDEEDKLIEEANQASNQSVRREKLQSAMRLSMEDVATIPLFQAIFNYAYDNNLLWYPRADLAIKYYELAGKE